MLFLNGQFQAIQRLQQPVVEYFVARRRHCATEILQILASNPSLSFCFTRNILGNRCIISVNVFSIHVLS